MLTVLLALNTLTTTCNCNCMLNVNTVQLKTVYLLCALCDRLSVLLMCNPVTAFTKLDNKHWHVAMFNVPRTKQQIAMVNTPF